ACFPVLALTYGLDRLFCGLGSATRRSGSCGSTRLAGSSRNINRIVVDRFDLSTANSFTIAILEQVSWGAGRVDTGRESKSCCEEEGGTVPAWGGQWHGLPLWRELPRLCPGGWLRVNRQPVRRRRPRMVPGPHQECSPTRL